MSFPRYPKYKDSGVEWLGEVPAHWDVKPLRRLVAQSNAGEVIDRTFWGGSLELLYTCAIQPLESDYEGFPDWKRTTLNDLLLTRNGTPYVHKPVKNAIYTNVVQRVTLVDGGDRNFLATTVQNSAENLRGYGVSIESLNYEIWKALPVPVPPLAEQTRIAEFLDQEMGKIDALVAEQQRLLELLKEKRQAVISHAVTKGLNPKAPLKPSGIEWLGDVPEHWEVVALKRIAQVQTGVAKGKDNSSKATITVPYLRVANVQDGFLDLDDVAMIEIPEPDLVRYALKRGDVLMNEGGDFDKLGRGCVWEGQIEPCITQNHVFAVRPHGVSSVWLNAVTSSNFAQFYFMGRSKQSTNLASISSTNLMELPVPLPPPAEQRTIISHLDAETAKFDTLTAEAQRAIDLLQERRTALISAAVTGQIDVRQT